MFKAILLLGGVGERFDAEKPKQFHRLSGKRVYQHTLDVFLKARFFDEVVLVVHPEWMELVQKEVGACVKIVQAGKTRQESSYRGLLACGEETEFVVIHDAVRPFVTEKILEENKLAVMQFGAVDTCIPSFDTIVECRESKIRCIPDRGHFWRGQTPQSFRYDWIKAAHEQALGGNASDDCQLVMGMGKEVAIVQGCEDNIKITTQLDLFMAEQLMRLRTVPLEKGQGSLLDRHFAVVGGTGGIGRAICEELEREGAKVSLLSRSLDVDIANEKEVQRAFDAIGEVDGLINAAGFLKRGTLKSLSNEEILQQISVNLNGVIFACRSAKVRAGGHIVNIASSSYARGREETPVYSAAKAGVVNFTQAISGEFPQLCINAIVPQRTKTAMRLSNFPGESDAELIDPEDVAKCIINLLKGPKITGQIIEVRKD